MSTNTLLTVEQFEQMSTADTEDYELVEGELIRLRKFSHAESISKGIPLAGPLVNWIRGRQTVLCDARICRSSSTSGCV